MTKQLDTTQGRVRALAILTRGSRSRGEIVEGTSLSLSTYTDFENGTRWPRAATLRRIEEALGWKLGAIDEAIAAHLAPELIGVEHMEGREPLAGPPRNLRSFSDSELAAEMLRRASAQKDIRQSNQDLFESIERGDLDLAASRDLGHGIRKGDLPDN